MTALWWCAAVWLVLDTLARLHKMCGGKVEHIDWQTMGGSERFWTILLFVIIISPVFVVLWSAHP